jgi:hypothetical protein
MPRGWDSVSAIPGGTSVNSFIKNCTNLGNHTQVQNVVVLMQDPTRWMTRIDQENVMVVEHSSSTTPLAATGIYFDEADSFDLYYLNNQSCSIIDDDDDDSEYSSEVTMITSLTQEKNQD